MRRKDREITDFNEVLAIMEKCAVCRLAMVDNGLPYVVPMNFAFIEEKGKITLYFHSAKEGRKIDILKTNPVVCVEMDCSLKLIVGENACDYTMNYKSIIGSGTAEFIDNEEEKEFALIQIMLKYSRNNNFEFYEKVYEHTALLKVTINEISGKKHLS